MSRFVFNLHDFPARSFDIILPVMINHHEQCKRFSWNSHFMELNLTLWDDNEFVAFLLALENNKSCIFTPTNYYGDKDLFEYKSDMDKVYYRILCLDSRIFLTRNAPFYSEGYWLATEVKDAFRLLAETIRDRIWDVLYSTQVDIFIDKLAQQLTYCQTGDSVSDWFVSEKYLSKHHILNIKTSDLAYTLYELRNGNKFSFYQLGIKIFKTTGIHIPKPFPELNSYRIK